MGFSAGSIYTTLMRYVVILFLLMAALSAASMSAIIFWLKRRIIMPLSRLRDVSERFVASSHSASEPEALIVIDPDIHTGDEMESLSLALPDMFTNMKRYMTDLLAVTAEKERIGTELNVATQIQADMLPRIFPAFPERCEFDLYASMDPAKEVGGDFYDFFLINDDHLALVMADVSGKGVPAALFMVIAKTLIKNRAQMGGSPAEILGYVNEQLCDGNDAELFVTVWLAIIEISTGKGIAANAGHEHPVICRGDGQYELVIYRHSPAVAAMEGIRFREHGFELHPGDRLFVYTDGVPEATNDKEELLGTDRMLAALNKHSEAAPAGLLTNVRTAIDNFVGGAPQFDDITMLGFHYIGTKEKPADELTLDSAVGNLDKVLAFVDERLEALDCPPKLQMQIDVAVEEIFVNIASYAYAPNAGPATIRFRADTMTGTVEITFIDWGVPYNPLAKPDPDVTLSAEERQIGGLGIYMVKKSMDDIQYEYRDGQNIVNVKHKKPGPPAAGPYINIVFSL